MKFSNKQLLIIMLLCFISFSLYGDENEYESNKDVNDSTDDITSSEIEINSIKESGFNNNFEKIKKDTLSDLKCKQSMIDAKIGNPKFRDPKIYRKYMESLTEEERKNVTKEDIDALYNGTLYCKKNDNNIDSEIENEINNEKNEIEISTVENSETKDSDDCE